MNRTLRNLKEEEYFSSVGSPDRSGQSFLRTSHIWLFLFFLFFSCVLLHKTSASNAHDAGITSVKSAATALANNDYGHEDDRAFLRYRGIQGVSLLRGREDTSKHDSFTAFAPTAWFLTAGVVEYMALPASRSYHLIAQASSVIQQFIICALPCRAGP